MTDDTPTTKQLWDFLRQQGVLDKHGHGLEYVDGEIVRLECFTCRHNKECLEIKVPCDKWEYKKEADNESR